MKRIVLVGMVLCMILGSTGCNTNKENENKNGIVKESNAVEKQDNIQKNNQGDNKETLGEVKDDYIEDQVNTDSVDLFDYLNCNEKEFIKKTKLKVKKEENPEFEHYIYTGYDHRLNLYFMEDKVAMIQIQAEIPGYNFMGIECGMKAEDAVNDLKELGYEVQFDDTDDTYQIYFDDEEEAGLLLSTENQKIIYILFN